MRLGEKRVCVHWKFINKAKMPPEPVVFIDNGVTGWPGLECHLCGAVAWDDTDFLENYAG